MFKNTIIGELNNVELKEQAERNMAFNSCCSQILAKLEEDKL